MPEVPFADRWDGCSMGKLLRGGSGKSLLSEPLAFITSRERLCLRATWITLEEKADGCWIAILLTAELGLGQLSLLISSSASSPLG